MDRKTTRRAERVTINQEFVSVDEFIHEYVTNVSATGAFIRSKDPLPIGTMVNLKFTIIMDDLETVEGVGEVVRVDVDGMGVEFRELSDRSRELLAQLVTPQPVPAAAPPPAPPRKR